MFILSGAETDNLALSIKTARRVVLLSITKTISECYARLIQKLCKRRRYHFRKVANVFKICFYVGNDTDKKQFNRNGDF